MTDRPSETQTSAGPGAGPPAAPSLNDMMTRLYEQLRQMAHAVMRGEKPMTLQPTALLHDAYLRLLQQRKPYENDAHLLGRAAKELRRALIDYARAKGALKRGLGRIKLPLDAVGDLPGREDPAIDILTLDDNLEKLRAQRPHDAELIELKFSCGLTNAEAARALGCDVATVERNWRQCKALLASWQTSK